MWRVELTNPRNPQLDDVESAPSLLRPPFLSVRQQKRTARGPPRVARTVARGWCANRKRCLLTPDGLALTKELCLKIGEVNQMSAYSFISVFDEVGKFDAGTKAVLVEAVAGIRDCVKDLESLFNQFSRLHGTLTAEA